MTNAKSGNSFWEQFKRKYWCPFKKRRFEEWVRLNDASDAEYMLKQKNDAWVPEKVGKRQGGLQWASATFEQRDRMYETLPVDDPEALAEHIFSWKNYYWCRWQAAENKWGEPQIKAPFMMKGYDINIQGASQVEKAQWAAACHFAELLMAWPNNPNRERYHRFDC